MSVHLSDLHLFESPDTWTDAPEEPASQTLMLISFKGESFRLVNSLHEACVFLG